MKITWVRSNDDDDGDEKKSETKKIPRRVSLARLSPDRDEHARRDSENDRRKSIDWSLINTNFYLKFRPVYTIVFTILRYKKCRIPVRNRRFVSQTQLRTILSFARLFSYSSHWIFRREYNTRSSLGCIGERRPLRKEISPCFSFAQTFRSFNTVDTRFTMTLN